MIEDWKCCKTQESTQLIEQTHSPYQAEVMTNLPFTASKALRFIELKLLRDTGLQKLVSQLELNFVGGGSEAFAQRRWRESTELLRSLATNSGIAQ
ncbi:hypothetical protein Tco_1052369 [Tanacetum coccineum]